VKDFLVTVFVVIAIIVLFVVLGGTVTSLGNGFSLGNWYHKWSVAQPGGGTHLTIDLSNEKIWAPATQGLVGESPFRNKVNFDTSDHDPQHESPHDEYLTIRSSVQNEGAIPLKGWSVESYVSKTRIPLPKGVLLYALGRKNAVVDPVLAPGEYAYIVSGNSPLENSFHTNSCTGQLATYAPFTPPLSGYCPAPSDIIPATVQNLRIYGEQCIEYIQSLAPCEVPGTNVPKDLLPLCRSLIQKELTYNNCIEREYKKYKFGVFNGGGWYLYLESPAEIWRNKYDVIRLLDADGRVVDVLSY
jgi:hypothetical protein